MVIEAGWRSNLPALGKSSPNIMTVITIEFLRWAMLRVTESYSECCRLRGSSRIAAKLVARTAGRNVAVLGLDQRSMALIAGRVCAGSRWNRKSHTAATGSMTSCTPDA